MAGAPGLRSVEETLSGKTEHQAGIEGDTMGIDKANEECLCAETSPAPDAFDGIYHWRSDCPYLNDRERSTVLALYGTPDVAISNHARSLSDEPRAARSREPAP